MSEVKNRMYYISKDENKFKLLIYQREREREKNVTDRNYYYYYLLLLYLQREIFLSQNYILSKQYIIRLAKTRLTNNLRNQYIMYQCIKCI